DITQRLDDLREWKREGASIKRGFKFDDFQGSVDFVNRITPPAEEMNHHPDITISWNKVELTLSTHSAGGLTESDFQLPARRGSLQAAIISLVSTYAPQNGYYAQKYPDVAARSLPVRLLFLGMTDTLARTGVETFSEMAARYHVYLEVGADMAQSWQVVCDDLDSFNRANPPRLPGGVLC